MQGRGLNAGLWAQCRAVSSMQGRELNVGPSAHYKAVAIELTAIELTALH